MESEEDADMDDLLFATFSALESGRGGSEELESGEAGSETGGDDEEDFVAEVARVEEDMERMKRLVTKLKEGNDKTRDGDIEQVSEIARGVEAKLEELESEEGSADRTTAMSNLRARLKEVLDPCQTLKGRAVSEGKEAVQRRSDDSQKRRRVVEVELSTVSVFSRNGSR